MQYVSVILPLKLPWCPVYSSEVNVKTGDRVRVKLAGREYDGIVWHTGVKPAVSPERVSPISTVETKLAGITARELRFWEFISDYYLCSIGEVYKTAYPESRIRSEKVALAQQERSESARERHREALKARAATLQARLSTKKQALDDRLSKELTNTGIRKDSKVADKLTAGIIRIEEELQRTLEALEADRSAVCHDTAADAAESSPHGTSHLPPPKPLVLVSSDRTGSYTRAIKDTLKQGRQVLILTPEKAFMDRLLSVMEECFPGKVLGYSSDDATAARRKASDRVRKEATVILGTRSALFLPYRDLGLIIIDEEQDTFYKQTEPNPRYHARDAAVMLASIHGAQVLLGTGSPSLETWYNCSTGKYAMQYEPVLTDTLTIDINAERRKNGMLGPVSRKLLQEISHAEGASIVIRSWENPEELEFGKFCPGRTVRVMTMQEFKREGPRGAALIGVLQADAFVSKDDFRADERAAQLMAQLSSFARKVVIQTSVPERFTPGRQSSDLLAERKTFHYPPFSRIIDINVEDNSGKRLSFICSRISGRLGIEPLTTGPDRRKFRLFLDKGASLVQKKHDIAEIISGIEKEFKYPGHMTMDVDPQ